LNRAGLIIVILLSEAFIIPFISLANCSAEEDFPFPT